MSSIIGGSGGRPHQSAWLGDGRLEDLTHYRLLQFRSRRLQLSLWRGLALSAIIFASTLLLAVLLDAFIDHPGSRWFGSLVLYASSLFAVYYGCLRPRSRNVALDLEAEMLEHFEPRLKNQLLSAVELAARDDCESPSSIAFQTKLQQQVADTLALVNVGQLLPWYLVRRFLVAGALCVGGLLCLCMIPGLHFPQRIARAMLPAADLGRVGRVLIRVERPMPQSKMVPRGDVVAIAVMTEGPAPNRVRLETLRDGELLTVAMAPVERSSSDFANSKESELRFETTLAADATSIEYRIVADDASTPWYRLSTAERPQVSSFDKRIFPPSYAGTEPQILKEDHGNIDAIIGSRVRIAIDLNQAVSRAELRWTTEETAAGTKTEEQPILRLEQDSTTGKFQTEFPILSSASYRIFLQSADSGFTNEFSPIHRITAIQDAAPLVHWTRPEAATIAAQATDILNLAVSVSDELPLAEVTQLSRVNSGNWLPNEAKILEEPISNPSDMAYIWNFDLAAWKLNAGDAFETKVIARDLAGNTGESSVLKIYISTASIHMDVSPAEESRLQIATHLEAFAAAIKDMVNPIADASTSQDSRPLKAAEIPTSSASLLPAKLRAEIPGLLAEIETASSSNTDSISVMELRLAGEFLTQLSTEEATKLDDASNSLKTFTQIAKRVGDQVNQLASHFRAAVTHDLVKKYAEQLHRLEVAHLGLAAAVDPSLDQRRRRQEILLRQLKEVQQAMLDTLESVRKDSRDRLRQSAENIGQSIDQIERKLETADHLSLAQLSANMASQLARARLLSHLDGNLPEIVKQSHQWLHQNVKPASDPLLAMVQSLTQRNMTQQQTSDALNQLASRRSLHRASEEGNREFAADIGSARRATESILESTSLTREKAPALNEVAVALRDLATAAEFQELRIHLESLSRTERWNLDSMEAVTDQPRRWNAFILQTEHTASLARQSRLPKTIADAIDRLRYDPTSAEIGRRIGSRIWALEPPSSATIQLDRLSMDMDAIAEDISPFVADARAILEKYAPTIAELARNAAAETDQLAQQTQDLSSALSQDQVPNTSIRMQQLERQLDAINDPLDELREALIDEADAQNLLDTANLDIARRADAALDIVERAEDQMQQSLTGIPTSEEPKATVERLNAAAEKQSDAASALEKLASMFEQAHTTAEADQQDIREQIAQLNELSDQMVASEFEPQPANRNATQDYAEAERLANLANASPEEVLRQLEKQLKTNKTMQAEISDIARTVANEALDRLDEAERQQRSIQPELEASDPTLLGQKKLFLHDLKNASDQARQLIDLLLAETKWTAGAAKEIDSEQMVATVESDLRAAVQTTEAIDLKLTYDEILTKANDLNDAIKQATQSLEQSRDELELARDVQIHQNGADLNNRRREMKDRGRRIQQQDARNAQQVERVQTQAVKRAEDDLRKASQQYEAIARKREQINERLQKQPGTSSLQTQLTELERDLALAETIRTVASKSTDEFKARAETAKQSLEQVNTRKLPELASDNPSAELAESLATLSVDRLNELSQTLGTWTAADPPAALATAKPLQTNSAKEDRILNEVDVAAANLARAARHESRLEHASTSIQLQAVANSVDSVGQNEIEAVRNKLNDAISNATSNQSPTAQADATATSNVSAASQSALSAIRQNVQQLRDMLAATPNANATATASSDAKSSTSDSGDLPPDVNPTAPVLAPKQMAQLLDELDRMLNRSDANDLNLGAKEDGSENAPGTPSTNPTQPGSLPSTLTEAAKQLASRISRGREPPPSSANSDLGMATDSQTSNADPQPPVAVRVIDVQRWNGRWGDLRQKNAEGTVESGREALGPEYREQVEAYFRNLSIQGRKESP